MNTKNHTRVSPATAKKLAELKAEAAALAEAKAMKNARLVLSRLNKHFNDRKPWERQTAQEIAKMHIQSLERFISAAKAPALRSVGISIEWKKSRTWGWCPRAFVRINGFTYESRAGGCGMSTLRAFLKECGWQGVQYDRETYDKQGGLISLFYSVEA